MQSLNIGETFKMAGSYTAQELGGVPAGESARREFQGPLVPGPWVYAFGLCNVIDNHGGTAAERRDAPIIEDGQVVHVIGYGPHRIEFSRRWGQVDRANVTATPVLEADC